MKIKQLDSGFKGVRRKGDPKEAKPKTPGGNSGAPTPPTVEYPQPPKPSELKSQGVTMKQALTPQYVGYVERSLVPILERMGFEGERLNLKKVNNIKGLYSEIIHSSPGNDMATAYAYLAVLLTWHGITPDPHAIDKEPTKPEQPEPKHDCKQREDYLLARHGACRSQFST